MKKHLLLLFSLVLATTMVFADRVSQEDAALVANNFLNGAVSTTKAGVKAATPNRMTLKKAASTATNESLYYVYENPDGGWVMVSASDVLQPILAYSKTGTFSFENQPDNVKKWLGKYEDLIKKVEADGVEASAEASAQWNALKKSLPDDPAGTVIVGPLVQTKWNQGIPYDFYTPGTGSYGSGTKAAVGCVATAMAQVMNYWQWPVNGTGSHKYQPEMDIWEENESTGEYEYKETIVIFEGELEADFENTTYQWAKMKNSYSSDYSADPDRAVATLMSHCGIAVDMQYGGSDYDGSGALTINYNDDDELCAQNALWKYFRYKKDGLVSYKRDGYIFQGTTYYNSWTEAAWTDMVKEELDKQHPIMYDGSGTSGHSFICDGYDSKDYFHFNWGWSGNNDGWYKLNNLVPGSGGAGGGSYSFSEDQSVIIGIVPDKPDEDLYILGEVEGNGYNWDPSKGAKMNFANNVFTLTTRIKGTGDYGYLSFTTALASGSSAWDEIASSRLGADASDKLVSSGSMYSLTTDYNNAFMFPNGVWTITVDLENKKMTAVKPTTYTVTWNIGGTATTVEFVKDAALELPAAPSACDNGKVFVGWTEATSVSSDAAPADIFTKAGTKTVTKNITYNAVFATATSGGSGAGWELVTDASTLKEGDVLVIASNSKGKTAGDISSSIMAGVESTFEGTDLQSLGDGTVELTLGGSEGAWTLTSSNGSLGATAVKKVAWNNGTTTWSISISDNNATIQNGTEAYGRFLYNVGTPRFTTYTSNTSSTMLLPQLYRKASSYSDYSLECGAAPAEPITIRFKNTDFWSEVYLWAWNDNGNIFNPWPGQKLTKDEDGFYTYTFDASITDVNVIFNNNDGSQTANLASNITESTCLIFDGYDGSTPRPAKIVDCSEMIPDLYILGQVPGNDYVWNPTKGTKMNYSKGKYTLTTRVAEAADLVKPGTINFTTKLAATADDDGWNSIAAYRLSAEKNEKEVENGKGYSLWLINESNSFKFAAGTWTIEVDLNNYWMEVILVEQEIAYTVNWSVAGVVKESKTYASGEELTMPEIAAPACEGEGAKVFVGWTAETTLDGSAPADLFTKAGGKTVTADVTYNAVFAKATTSSGGGSTTPTTVSMGDLADISGTVGDFTFAADKGGGSTNPAYNTSAKDLRIYAKGTLTISSESTMSEIVFAISSQGKKRLAPITASTGTIAEQASGDEFVTWTGSATSVTFTVGDKADYGSDSDKAGQLCFGSVDITTGGGSSTTYSEYALTCDGSAISTTKYVIAGNLTELGDWDLTKAPELTVDGNIATLTIEDVPINDVTMAEGDIVTDPVKYYLIRYKAVIIEGENQTWIGDPDEGDADGNYVLKIYDAGIYKFTFTLKLDEQKVYIGVERTDFTDYVFKVVQKPSNWDAKVNIFAWGTSTGAVIVNNEDASVWPGVTMGKDDDGYYSADLRIYGDGNTPNLIFTDGANQTVDLISQSASARYRINETKEDGKNTADIVYKATLGDATNGALTFNTWNAENENVTVAATPDEGYALTKLIVKDDKEEPVEVDGNTFVMPAKDVTVSAVFSQLHTIKWVVLGAETAQQVADGAALVLPAVADCANGSKFVGWTAESSLSGDRPADLFATATGKIVTADATYYAVYAAVADVADALTNDIIGAAENTYANWSDITVVSDAVYAGNSAGTHNAIQLRSSGNTAGVITTTSGGKARRIAVDWNSNTVDGRTLNVYGSNSAYTQATDLYDESLRGTSLGTIKKGSSNELFINGDYEYIGIRSANSALYLDKLEITWDVADDANEYTLDCGAVIAKHTVTWSACGDEYDSQEYEDGELLVFPTAPGKNSAGKEFVGWIAEEHYSDTTSPTFIEEGSQVKASVTYYAVYK